MINMLNDVLEKCTSGIEDDKKTLKWEQRAEEIDLLMKLLRQSYLEMHSSVFRLIPFYNYWKMKRKLHKILFDFYDIWNRDAFLSEKLEDGIHKEPQHKRAKSFKKSGIINYPTKLTTLLDNKESDDSDEQSEDEALKFLGSVHLNPRIGHADKLHRQSTRLRRSAQQYIRYVANVMKNVANTLQQSKSRSYFKQRQMLFLLILDIIFDDKCFYKRNDKMNRVLERVKSNISVDTQKQKRLQQIELMQLEAESIANYPVQPPVLTKNHARSMKKYKELRRKYTSN
ncbi:hypothetical protein SNEBB_007171 [Seison nebaliae]|nr:hypothetical protein SNEBB_007171 [Seison nebaliae]